ncbi:MAG TPA: hypothetical protein VE733_09380 [Streptosporangiaceae bacterium]|jgi:transposase-like protein|nr:hypothetical protein [Streptosporangiaceae bacterium]
MASFVTDRPDSRAVRVIFAGHRLNRIVGQLEHLSPGHFPNEAAALKCVYMAVISLDPTGQGRKRWTMRWKPALQAFDIAFGGRLSLGRR